MTHGDVEGAVAEMVESLGYGVFIWDSAIFNRVYRIVQVNPQGIWIIIHEGTRIEVGATLNAKTWMVDGGTILDMADPKTTEQRLGEVIKAHS